MSSLVYLERGSGQRRAAGRSAGSCRSPLPPHAPAVHADAAARGRPRGHAQLDVDVEPRLSDGYGGLACRGVVAAGYACRVCGGHSCVQREVDGALCDGPRGARGRGLRAGRQLQPQPGLGPARRMRMRTAHVTLPSPGAGRGGGREGGRSARQLPLPRKAARECATGRGEESAPRGDAPREGGGDELGDEERARAARARARGRGSAADAAEVDGISELGKLLDGRACAGQGRAGRGNPPKQQQTAKQGRTRQRSSSGTSTRARLQARFQLSRPPRLAKEPRPASRPPPQLLERCCYAVVLACHVACPRHTRAPGLGSCWRRPSRPP